MVYPQLFPAPPPSLDEKMFSGLNKLEKGDERILLMTLGSRSSSKARGM